jgi:protein O-GlcNAc transferase
MAAQPKIEPKNETALRRIPFERCPLCEHEDAEEVKVSDCRAHPMWHPKLPSLVSWIRCDACKHVFTDGYFDDDALAVLFRDVQDQQRPGHDVGRARGTAAKILEDVARFRDRLGGRWLDVGFGDGSLVTTAAEFGYEAVGLDLREESVARMRAMGFEAHAVDLEKFDAPPFDVISMADVLEHMPFPKPALAKAHSLLAADGLLFLSMPNMDAFAWKDLETHAKNPYWAEIEHVHNFGRARLYALLEEMGFSPCRYGISQRYVACMEVVARKIR